MRLFADECVARSIIQRLRAEGFDVVCAADVCPTEDDERVLALAHEDGRVLITADKDFGELVVRLRLPAHGVINLALGDLTAAAPGTNRNPAAAGVGWSHRWQPCYNRAGPGPHPPATGF